MSGLHAWIHALNDISPMGLCAMLAYIIYQLVARKSSIRTITDNHLSSLPTIADELKTTNALLTEVRDDGKKTREDINYVKGVLTH